MHIQAGDDLELLIRSANADDDRFIFGLIDRFVNFELPRWRKRTTVAEGIRNDLARHLDEPGPGSFLFVAETDNGERVAFAHLQTVTDFFSGGLNCHVSDLVVAKGWDGRGIGRALLRFAEDFAREHRCERLTLAVFPGNENARKLYESEGYGVELVRMAKPL
ncbi:MAG TPA: GNAT family N-acetyltransferase [Xanthomonadaceae bacterium]|nr:GNAT family N-acetyltransferase [Xanthomonadaceae bacterium]